MFNSKKNIANDRLKKLKSSLLSCERANELPCRSNYKNSVVSKPSEREKELPCGSKDSNANINSSSVRPPSAASVNRKRKIDVEFDKEIMKRPRTSNNDEWTASPLLKSTASPLLKSNLEIGKNVKRYNSLTISEMRENLDQPKVGRFSESPRFGNENNTKSTPVNSTPKLSLSQFKRNSPFINTPELSSSEFKRNTPFTSTPTISPNDCRKNIANDRLKKLRSNIDSIIADTAKCYNSSTNPVISTNSKFKSVNHTPPTSIKDKLKIVNLGADSINRQRIVNPGAVGINRPKDENPGSSGINRQKIENPGSDGTSIWNRNISQYSNHISCKDKAPILDSPVNNVSPMTRCSQRNSSILSNSEFRSDNRSPLSKDYKDDSNLVRIEV